MMTEFASRQANMVGQLAASRSLIHLSFDPVLSVSGSHRIGPSDSIPII